MLNFTCGGSGRSVRQHGAEDLPGHRKNITNTHGASNYRSTLRSDLEVALLPGLLLQGHPLPTDDLDGARGHVRLGEAVCVMC